MLNNPIGYLIARLVIAMSMFGHGVARIPKLTAFSNGMASGFQNTILPASLVHLFGMALPIFEFLVGVFLIFGFFTREAIIIGAVIIVLLIFGSSLTEKWDAVAIQMFYGLYFAILFTHLPYNIYSVDYHYRRVK